MNFSVELFARALRANVDVGGSPYDEKIKEHECSKLPSNEDDKTKNSIFNLGENGTLQYTIEGVQDIRLVMFTGLIRNTQLTKVDEFIDMFITKHNEIKLINVNKAKGFLCDIFLILFEKRDCRGGEGEKMIFYHMIWRLYQEFPEITTEMIELIPEYGSWKDPWQIIDYIRKYELSLDQSKRLIIPCDNVVTRQCADIEIKKKIVDKLIEIAAVQFQKDLLIEDQTPISLVAKWLPTEGCEFAKHNYVTWKRLAKLCIGDSAKNPEKDYRKTVSRMREKINITETLMCSRRYMEIDPSKTPSVCTLKFRRAFLNTLTEREAVKRNRESKLLVCENVTGNRFPKNFDRVACRKKWIEAIKKNKVKGGQLSPDTMVVAIRSASTQDEKDLINAQWKDLVKSIQVKVEKAKSEGYIPMDNIIPMIDMSPSMDGTPKNAAIGLGIMLSELNSNSFGGLAITFDSLCHVVDLKKAKTFSEKVRMIDLLPVGCSTNFNLAMDRICEIIIKYKIPKNLVPSLCILSDEQFDHRQFGYNKTMETQLAEKFEDVGIEVSSKPYAKPRTVHWNLRGDTEGFAAKADDKNVQMLAGYSPSLFDLILCGKPSPTPFETMRRKLDSERYELVRVAFKSSFK